MKKEIILFFVALISAPILFAQASLTIPAGITVKTNGNAYIVLRDMDLINNSSFLQESGKIKFTGNANVVISGSGTTTINDLLLSKGEGSVVKLKTDLGIVSSINFDGGLLNVGSGIVDLGATGVMINESENSRAYSFGKGYIQAVALLNAPSQVNPGGMGAIISSAANIGKTIVRRSFLSSGNVVDGVSILREFEFLPSNNTALNATLRLKYLEAELNGLDENSLVFWKSPDDKSWLPNGATNINIAANYVELTGVNTLSKWTLSRPPATVLPILFGNVQAIQQGKNVMVKWQMLNEINTATYAIQRSSDGINFTTISTIAAANLSNYHFTDLQPLSGNNYYRLQSAEQNNSVKYSSIVKINTEKKNASIDVYPNPVIDKKVQLRFANRDKGIYQLELFSTNGQKVFTQTLDHAGGSCTSVIQLPVNIAKGNYQLSIKNNTNNYNQSLIVQ